MAQVDVQWPSEDEDFDAVTDKAKSDTVEGTTRVAVTTENNAPTDEQSDESQPTDNESAEESHDEPSETGSSFFKPDKAAQTDEHQEAEPEESVAEPEAQAEPEPESDPQPSNIDIPPVAVSQPPKTAKAGKGRSVARLLFELVLVACLIGVGYYAYTLRNDRTDLQTQVTTLKNNPQLAVQKQADDLIRKVGLLIQLPTDETPTIASVSDASQAKKQSAFFNNAQNGDKVLMYAKAGKAILYRPSTNKIILQAPLTFTSNTAASTTKTTPAATTH